MELAGVFAMSIRYSTDVVISAEQFVAVLNASTVSYTHLDVYKRQPLSCKLARKFIIQQLRAMAQLTR